jgi:mannose-6-phosphate isomerase-like protein (cupin superfamily)
MKILKSQQAQEFKNGDTCTAFEYPLEEKSINIAVIKLNGRYPETGQAMNTECKEIAYVIEGTGEVSVEGKITKINKGDVVLIEPKEKFYWNGKLTILMPCTPAWTPEQYKHIA